MQALLFILTAIVCTAVSKTITEKYRPPSPPAADALSVTAGATVSFNWSVDVPPGRDTPLVLWLFEQPGKSNVTVASLVNDKFYPSHNDYRVTYLPNAGIQLSKVTPEQSGRYYVIAKFAGHGGQNVTSFENGASLFVSALRTVIHRCPDDWVYFEDFCYAFLDAVVPWSTAVEMCRLLGSSLVVITNVRENDFVAAQLRARHDTSKNNWYWIHFNDLVREGRWVQGDNHEPLAFNRWARGQPNNGLAHENGEDCAVIIGDGTWHDLWCQDYPRDSFMPRPVCKMSVVLSTE